MFNVRDNRLASGSVSLYCGQNAGGQFRDVRVDDLRGNAPVVYRFKFTTSDFTDFRHHIHSFQGLVFRAALADLNDVAASVGAAVALAAANQQPAEAEARAYNTLADKALGTAARQPVTRLDVSRVEHGGSALALIVRTADPLDWRRTTLSLLLAPAQLLQSDPPTGPRLIRATFAMGAAPQPNDESVTALLDAAHRRTALATNIPAAAVQSGRSLSIPEPRPVGRSLRGIEKRTPGRGVQSSAGGLFLSREPLGGHSLSKLLQ